MPLTDEQLNLYEQNLKKSSDDAARAKLGNIGAGYADYGSPSMTNTVNNYNYDRMNDYMNALAQRENLAQTWQQVANQRALTSGQLGNMEKEHERGLQQIGLQKQQLKQAGEHHQQDLKQSWNIAKQKHDLEKEQMEKGYNLQKEQFEHQKKQAAIGNLMQKAMQIYNMQLGKRQLSQTDWVNKTNALLQNMGLQISQDKLNYVREHPENLPFDADGNPTGDQSKMLSWLSNILTSSEQASGNEEDRASNRRRYAADAQLQGLQFKHQLFQLQAENPALWSGLIQGAGHIATGLSY
jgi:hypothetical protein